MRKKIENTLITLLGIFFLLLGFVGLLIPLVPQFIFLFIGIYLVSINSVFVKKRLDHFLDKYPRVRAFERNLDKVMKQIFKKVGIDIN